MLNIITNIIKKYCTCTLFYKRQAKQNHSFRSTVHVYSSLTNKCTFLFKKKKHIKIYIKIHTNITPTCFGLQPSSGSLN